MSPHSRFRFALARATLALPALSAACLAHPFAMADSAPMSAGRSTTAPPPAASTTPGSGGGDASSLVLEDFPSYLREVETIRGLAFTRPVAKGRQSIDEFRAFLGREIEREMPAARAACTSRALGRLGLVPEGFDLSKAYEDVLLSQVAAYYDPESKTFYVVRAELPAETMRPTVIHELAHALQDQRYGLAGRIEALRRSGNEDEENAFRFLAEGEATYVMTLGVLRDAGLDTAKNQAAVDSAVEAGAGLDREALAAQIQTMTAVLDPGSAASMKSVLTYPDYLFRLLLDPYYLGQRAVHRTFRRGGWAAVDDLWKHPPASTELFLHPEKLASIKRDEPVRVEVPDLSAALGPGYARACENTLGEMETEMLLEATLPKPGDAQAPPPEGTTFYPPLDETMAARLRATLPREPAVRNERQLQAPRENAPSGAASTADWAHRAASGWGGDRYRMFEKNGGASVVVWKTVWDTDRAADGFDDAMNHVCNARMPKNAPTLFLSKASDETSEAPVPAFSASASSMRSSAMLWKTSGEPSAQSLLLVRQGREVTFVAGASVAQGRAILGALAPSLEAWPPMSRPSPDVVPPTSQPLSN